MKTDNHDDHQESLEELSKLSGREFDLRYMEEMIDDHEAGIAAVERKAENASDADVKAWAAKTLPKMRQHLERAKTIKETLDRAGNQSPAVRRLHDCRAHPGAAIAFLRRSHYA